MPRENPKTILFALSGLAIVALVLIGFWLGVNYILEVAPWALHQKVLVPESYRGEGVIVFYQPDGVPLEREDGSWIFRVQDPYIWTQSAQPPGPYDMEFYFVDSTGKRTAIPTYITCEDNVPNDPIVACWNAQLTGYGGKRYFIETFTIGHSSERRNLIKNWRANEDAAMKEAVPLDLTR
jgi:Family of unknown function (DUF6843)